MLGSEAITRIQRKLGYLTTKADEILEELVDSQQSLELGVPSPMGKGTYTPWFLISEVASALTTIGEERIELPADFAGEMEGFQLYYFNEDAEADENAWVRLVKGDEAFFRGQVVPSTDDEQAPAGYFYSGSYWRIWPVPTAEWRLKIIHAAADSVPTSAATNKWLTWAPWVLIGHAGASMAGSVRDPSAQQFFLQRFAVENNSLWAQTEARFQSNDRPVMGGQT